LDYDIAAVPVQFDHLVFQPTTMLCRFLAISHWSDRVFDVAMMGLKVLSSKN